MSFHAFWQWNQHIENSRASLWNPENSEFWVWKRLFAWALSKFFFSHYTIFTWIWTCKTHDLTVYQLIVSSSLPAITFMESDQQIPGWLHFFQQQSFPSVPSLQVPSQFQLHYYFEASTSIVYVLFRPQCHSATTLIISYCWFWNLCYASQMISPGNCNPAPFQVGFNSPIIFQSLLLEFSCVNPATLISQDQWFLKLWSARARSTLENSSCFLPCLFQSLDCFWKPPPRVILCKFVHANLSGQFFFKTPLTHCHHPPVIRCCRDCCDCTA